MDRRPLEVFIAVVDHGSISAAADALGCAQPTVSIALAGLERGLGVPLFHRMARGVRPTSAGEALVEPARAVLRDFAVLESIVRAVHGLDAGTLDIIAIPTLTHELAALVGRFHAAHPAVTVRCGDPGVEPLEVLVRTGRCDLALGEVPADARGVVVVPIGAQPFLLALPPGSAPATTIDRRALAALTYVATPPGTSSRTLLDEAAAAPRIAVETAQREALVPLVIAGAGAALLPEPLARHAQALGAVLVAPEPPLERRFALLHRPGPLTPAAMAFLALTTADSGVSGRGSDRAAASRA